MKQMEGLRFRRQQPIDKYIVDFVCFEKRIIIEVDGGQHATEGSHDRERDAYLRQAGFKVLRFWNNEVMQSIDGVLEVIRANCFITPST
jgi:very-short-patch-repair endonuclease